MGEIQSYLDIPPPFFFSGAARPCFFEPSQFVSWSAQPLEPIRETLLSALHDIVSTAERKVSMFDCSKFAFLAVIYAYEFLLFSFSADNLFHISLEMNMLWLHKI